MESRETYYEDHPEEDPRRPGAQGDPADQDDFPDFQNEFWHGEREHETRVPHEVEFSVGFKSTLDYPVRSLTFLETNILDLLNAHLGLIPHIAPIWM